MRSPAFQFYVDDFFAGTAEMSQAEVGAYIRLLCHQWNRGSIPVETEKQQRLAGGSISVDVLSKFPADASDGLLKNRRLELEREKQAKFRELQRSKGLASAASRKTGQPDGNRGSTAVQPEPQPKGNSPSPSPSPINTRETPSATRFDEFWEAYPKKVAKDQAKAKFEKLSADDQSAAIARVRVDSGTEQWTKDNGKFIPNPTTYLNQRRWEAVVDLKPKQDGLMFGMTEEEILRQAL